MIPKWLSKFTSGTAKKGSPGTIEHAVATHKAPIVSRRAKKMSRRSLGVGFKMANGNYITPFELRVMQIKGCNLDKLIGG